MAIRERQPIPQTEVPQPLDAVSMQEIMQMLSTLPTPITIERKVDERTENIYYTWQVGEKTTDQPVGYGMGASRHFLEAVELSLKAALTQGLG